MSFSRLTAGLLLAAAALIAPGAHAHAIVVKSSPAPNAAIVPGSLAVTVTFNTRLDRARSRLSLEAPDGRTTTVMLRDDLAPTTLGGHSELATPGRWKLRWQVLAADGHITRGEIPFRVMANR
jgi:methionine-rich copper-binding protein CopC